MDTPASLKAALTEIRRRFDLHITEKGYGAHLGRHAAEHKDVAGTLDRIPTGVGGSAPSTSSYVTISAEAGLTSERRVTAGNAIGLTDGGANSTLTIALSIAGQVIGDIIYHTGALWDRLAGNTTTTKKFLTQTGDGAASAAPAWGTIVDGDVPATHSGSAHHAQLHNHSAAGDGQTLQPLNYKWPTSTELTVNAGAITLTQSHHRIDTEGDAATDDIDTINGLVASQWYLFRPESAARTVVFKHNVDNIYCVGGADISLTESWDIVLGFAPSAGGIYIMQPGGPDMPTFNDHSARHENGGGDEISVAGLSGELADLQPVKAHNHTAAAADGGIATDDEHDGFSEYAEIAKPANPAANKLRVYAKDDGAGVTKLYGLDSAGTETAYGAAGAGGGDVATDTIWATKGDLAVATANDAAAVLPVVIPGAANLLNVLGAATGEDTPTYKVLFDGTAPEPVGTAAAGTGVVAAHRNHVHAHGTPTSHDRRITCAVYLTPVSDTVPKWISPPLPLSTIISAEIKSYTVCGATSQVIDIGLQTAANKNTNTNATIWSTHANCLALANTQYQAETATFNTTAIAEGDRLYVFSHVLGTGLTVAYITVTIRPT